MRYEITALQRGLKILTVLTESEREMTATEIAHAVSLTASTICRFLVNLEGTGFIRRNSRGSYQLGPACLALGRAALNHLEIREASMPVLKELNRATQETVHLTVRNGVTAVYIEKIDSPLPVRIFSRVGATVPIYCTAVGKILLAFLDFETRSEILSKTNFIPFTPTTPICANQVEEKLAAVRRLGYAIDNEEHEQHIRCIAAPIWNHAGEVVAAFSLTGPTSRMQRSRVRELVPLIVEASQAISKGLGFRGLEMPTRGSAADEGVRPNRAHSI